MTKEQLRQHIADNYPVSGELFTVEVAKKQWDVVAKIESGEITTTSEIDSQLA